MRRSGSFGPRDRRARGAAVGALRAHRRRRGKLVDGQLQREIGARRLLEHISLPGLERLSVLSARQNSAMAALR